MTGRTIVVDSEIWKVYPTGRITVYGKDEFGLLFELGTGPERKRRFTRYSPLRSKSTDASLAELTEQQRWTSSANRSPRGRRPRADTAHSERSASWTRPRVSLSQPAECLLRLAEPPWSRSRSLAVQRRQGRQLGGEAPLPALFTTARADRQNRAGVWLRAAIGVGPDPRDTCAFPTVSFINEGTPAARPIAREGVGWGGRLVASHFRRHRARFEPKTFASENRSPALTSS